MGDTFFFLIRLSRRWPAVAVQTFSQREKPRAKSRLAPPIVPKLSVGVPSASLRMHKSTYQTRSASEVPAQ